MSEKQKEIKITTIKSILGAVPYLGTFLNEVFFEYNSRINQKRIELFCAELENKIDKMGKSIPENYIASEDFHDFTISVFEKVVRIKNEEKRRILANVYLKGIEKSIDPENNKSGILLDLILNIKPIQISILKFIKDFKTELNGIEKYSSLYDLYDKKTQNRIEDQYEFKYYILDLESKGLITTEGGLIDYNEQTSYLLLEDSKMNSVYLTGLGEDFIANLF